MNHNLCIKVPASGEDGEYLGWPHANALTAGLFLSNFVEEGIPWAHLDIAGPAFTDAEDGETAKGGTGFGVRLLLDALVNFEPSAAAGKSEL